MRVARQGMAQVMLVRMVMRLLQLMMMMQIMRMREVWCMTMVVVRVVRRRRDFPVRSALRIDVVGPVARQVMQLPPPGGKLAPPLHRLRNGK